MPNSSSAWVLLRLTLHSNTDSTKTGTSYWRSASLPPRARESHHRTAPCSPPAPGVNQEEEQLLSLMGQGQTCQGIRSHCENFCHSHTFPSFTCQQTLTRFSVQTSDFLLSIRDVLTRTDLLGTVKKALESSPNPMIHQKTHRKK